MKRDLASIAARTSFGGVSIHHQFLIWIASWLFSLLNRRCLSIQSIVGFLVPDMAVHWQILLSGTGLAVISNKQSGFWKIALKSHLSRFWAFDGAGFLLSVKSQIQSYTNERIVLPTTEYRCSGRSWLWQILRPRWLQIDLFWFQGVCFVHYMSQVSDRVVLSFPLATFWYFSQLRRTEY